MMHSPDRKMLPLVKIPSPCEPIIKVGRTSSIEFISDLMSKIFVNLMIFIL